MATNSANANKLDDRRDVVREFKKGLIRDAARQTFAERGMEGATLREIAQAAGYTTGAIYTYFDTKEELYAEVLRDSLHALRESVSVAVGTAVEPSSAAALRGLWAFYDERPTDFELGFYLYGGVRPAGLNKPLDDELNLLFSKVMSIIGDALVADGLTSPDHSHHLAVVHATWVFGLLLMDKTGRVRSVEQSTSALLSSYLQMATSHRLPSHTGIEDRS